MTAAGARIGSRLHHPRHSIRRIIDQTQEGCGEVVSEQGSNGRNGGRGVAHPDDLGDKTICSEN
jgi:hypothetical protein